MIYRRLGRSSLKLSALSLGTWRNFIAERSEHGRSLLHAAIHSGINVFDTAENYAEGAADEVLGLALKELRIPRDSFCISAKVGYGVYGPMRSLPTQHGISAKHLIEGCNQSLRRLRLDYVDLFACHLHDPRAEVGEVVWAMNQLIENGKVLYWGTSKWPASRIAEAIAFARENHLRPPTYEQPSYNLLARGAVHDDLIELCEEGLGLMTWSPLQGGMLLGRSGVRQAEASQGSQRVMLPDSASFPLSVIAKISEVAQEMRITSAQLLLIWCLRNRYVSSVIMGASRVEQLLENIEAVELMHRLTDELWLALIEFGETASSLPEESH